MKQTRQVKESGYALLSLLVAMTIGLVILTSMAAKPSAQFVGQRENEEEAFFRAQQVNYAIKLYTENVKGGLAAQNLPTKLEDLLDKYQVRNTQGIAEQYLIRKSSLIDPLTGEEWKPIRLGDPKVREFARTYMRVIAEQQALLLASGGGVNPGIAGASPAQAGMPPFLALAAQAGGINMANPNSTDDKEDEEGKNTSASGFSLGLDSDSRPIIGVMSSSKKAMIRDYYTIATYDKALFIHGVKVPGLATLTPLGGGGITGIAPGGTGGQDEPGQAPVLRPGQCPPGSTDPRCARNRNPNQ
jgi:hypothetical protein